MLKQILLGFLQYGPMTGYDLKTAIDGSTAHFWHAHHSQIYTALRDMEADGLVASELVAETGQPNRRVYTLTAAGRADLRAWLDVPMTELPPLKDAFLVRLFFSAGREKQAALAELRIQRDLHRQKLALYQSETESLIEQHRQHARDRSADPFFWGATLRIGEAYERAYIASLDAIIADLEAE